MWKNVFLFISKRYLLAKDLLSSSIGYTTKHRYFIEEELRRKNNRGPGIRLGRNSQDFVNPIFLFAWLQNEYRGADLLMVCFSSFQPVSTDFAQYSSYGDVSGGVRGEAPAARCWLTKGKRGCAVTGMLAGLRLCHILRSDHICPLSHQGMY